MRPVGLSARMPDTDPRCPDCGLSRTYADLEEG
jgi:hypothetical protein